MHITSGFSALVCALYLGKRLGYPEEPMPPHSLVLSVIGACLLWVGWFGFNAGSALAAGRPGVERVRRDAFRRGRGGRSAGCWSNGFGRANRPCSAAISGAVAGLVAITPASGFVTPMSALIIGFIAGVVCFFAVTESEEARSATTIRSTPSASTASAASPARS